MNPAAAATKSDSTRVRRAPHFSARRTRVDALDDARKRYTTPRTRLSPHARRAMPKSKRAKVVSLTQTKKKDREWKSSLIERVRDALSERSSVYVFKYENMRNGTFKEMRAATEATTTFFVGSNKVLRVALGRDAESEASEGAATLGARVKGDCGVMFTDLSREDVESVFERFAVKDYARTGAVARETVTVEAGPVHGPSGALMEHTLEPTLRKNGMPTKLNRGVIELEANHTLCKEGQHISPQGAILLRLFGHELAEFRCRLTCGLVNGELEVYEEDDEGDDDDDGPIDRFAHDGITDSMMLPPGVK
jgi:mRNA turnover protein 4